MPIYPFRRAIFLASLLALLAGCAAQPLHQASPPTPLNALTITPADLQKAEQEAYNQGFDAGRRYQRKHDQVAVSPAQPDTAEQDVPPPAQADGKTQAPTPAQPVCPPQVEAKPPALAPIPPLPPSSSYTTSGPAQPLAQ